MSLPSVADDADITDYLFRYDFTSGEKVYSHNGHETEPTALWSGYTAVNGPDGYGTAVHPVGKGTITDGDTILNADWTLAMSVKSCDVEKGVLLGLGSIETYPGQELLVCSSSTEGSMYFAVAQRWGSTSTYKNAPSTLTISGLGDTTKSFHSLVVVFTTSDKKLAVYWDGVHKGDFYSNYNMGDKSFKTGFQFCTSHGDLEGDALSKYYSTSGNPDAAFRDVRLYTRAFGEDDIAAYAAAFPAATAATCDVDSYDFRHNFTSGKLVVEGSGYTDSGMAGTGTAVDDPAGYGTATFPDSTGYGTIDAGLNRDWTAAMTFRSSTTIDNAILFCLGGDYTGKTRGLVVRTSTTDGQLGVSTVQNWGGTGNAGSVNVSNSGTLTGLGDTSSDFHTLVVVYSRNIKEKRGSTETGGTSDSDLARDWKTGVFSFYWDGEWAGSLNTYNGGTGVSLMDKIRYGSIYNVVPSSYTELTDSASGVAFRDFRFASKIWTSTEAKNYTKATSPLKDSLFRYDFTSGTKVYTHDGLSTEPVAEWYGYTPVNGSGGYGTAVHPCGVGTITDGENLLNTNDWSIAMSVKPGSLERGLFLGIGGTRATQNGRELCFLSSSTPGKISVVSRQTWGGQWYNEPSKLEVTGIGDTSNTFHTIVATCTAYDSVAGTNAVKVYVDGVLKGTFDADYRMTQTFKSSFMFSAAYEYQQKIRPSDARIGWNDAEPYYDVSRTMDTAFQDIRFFTRILREDEIARYAALYPAAQAATNDIGDYSFRHDFSTGRLVVEGDGFTDDSTNPMAGSGTKVYGAKEGTRYAVFPDCTRLGTVDGGFARDWTCAMSVKPGTVDSGDGVLLSIGGNQTYPGKAIIVSNKPDSGLLRFTIAQRWGSGTGARNTTNNGTITDLGDTVNEFHTLVLVYSHEQRTLKGTIDGGKHTGDSGNSARTGVFTIYWDGEFAGTLATDNGSDKPFLSTMRYGTVEDVLPSSYYALADSSCGAAFQDLRFVPRVWTTDDARAYAELFPVSKQAKARGFTVFVR